MNFSALSSTATFAAAWTLLHCGPAPTSGPVNTGLPAAPSESAPAATPAASAAMPVAPAATPAAPAAPAASSASSEQAVPKASTKPSESSSSTKAPAKPVEAPITSVRVYVSNQCAKKVEYCVENGSTLNTSLGSNASTTHTVSPGAKFKIKNGSSCGNVVFTAPAAKDEQKFNICSR